MRLGGNEKRLLIAATVVAVVLGLYAGGVAYFSEAEAQFHGGVLEEDAAFALWTLVLETVTGFVEAAAVTILLLGVIPLAIWRVFTKWRRGDV